MSEWLKKAGLDQAHIPDDKPNVFNPDPMTLGDIASLYQVLGNDGVHRKLKIIQTIQSRAGQILYDDSKPDKDVRQDALLNSLDDRQMTLTMRNAASRRLGADAGGAITASSRPWPACPAIRRAIAMPGLSATRRSCWLESGSVMTTRGRWGRDVALKSAVPLWGEVMRQIDLSLPTGGDFAVPAALTKVEIDRSTGALRGLAGLAPAPGDIFVYLKKEQVDAAGGTSTAQQIQAPRNGATG